MPPPPSSSPPSTPPATTLSTPSPTELHDQDPTVTAAITSNPNPNPTTMPPTPSPQHLKHIYLVVATTRCKNNRLGIGLNGKLPWPMVRADMNYFRDVTREGDGGTSQRTSSSTSTGATDTGSVRVTNSVIMGRKTYESIPPRFRPLGGRTNVIVTRSKPIDVARGVVEDLRRQAREARAKKDELNEQKQSVNPTSPAIAQQLRMAGAEFTVAVGDDGATNVATVRCKPEGVVPGVIVQSSLRSAAERALSEPGEVYCIGGAEIYDALLRDETLRSRLRVLQTEIQKVSDEAEEFECDTFWSEDLEDPRNGWSEAQTGELVRWTGVDPPQGTSMDWVEDEKVGVRLRVRGWEQRGTSI